LALSKEILFLRYNLTKQVTTNNIMTKIYDMEDIERRLSALEGKKDIIKCPIEIEMFNNMYYIQNERQNLSYEPSDNIWRVS